MIHLKTLHELKKHAPSHEVVHVKSVNKLFKCHDGEWIERAYYSTAEIAEILGVHQRRVQHVIKKMNLQPLAGVTKSLSYHQLVLMAKIQKIKAEKPKMRYSEIKKALGL